ncbi:MAG TPA: CAP domain-containing protein [Hyalangium sp.]|nr:CAP domain-containing protein [Hyalangium sp.]
MRPLSPLLFSMLLCATPLCLTGCDFGDGGSQQPDGGGTPPDAPFAQEMLSAHNSVRISATPTPNPALPTLTWSTDTAATAQAWADQCQFRHNPNRGNLGENIAAATPNHLSTLGVVQNWAAESAHYNYGTNSCAGGQTCGHYTQIVWRNTTQVGCATKLCDENSPFSGFTQWRIWVCNYSPPGNIAGQRPY